MYTLRNHRSRAAERMEETVPSRKHCAHLPGLREKPGPVQTILLLLLSRNLNKIKRLVSIFVESQLPLHRLLLLPSGRQVMLAPPLAFDIRTLTKKGYFRPRYRARQGLWGSMLGQRCDMLVQSSQDAQHDMLLCAIHDQANRPTPCIQHVRAGKGSRHQSSAILSCQMHDSHDVRENTGCCVTLYLACLPQFAWHRRLKCHFA